MPVAVLRSEVDPFADLMAPPVGETEPEKAARLRREQEAQRISNAIDEEINKARLALKREKDSDSVVKVLLLGQSESGKSTTLKNFRMAYARDEWERERASWRAVIQMNLIRSIGIILDALQAEANDEYVPRPSSTYGPLLEVDSSQRRTSSSEVLLAPKHQNTDEEQKIPLSDKHEHLRRRLAPLQHVESDLKRVLGAGVEEVRSMDMEGGDVRDNVPLPSIDGHESSPRKRAGQEVFVRPWLWKEALQTGLHGSAYNEGERIPGLNSDSRYEETGLQQASQVIANCKDDMKDLWLDETVQRILKKRNIHIEESAGFFLDYLDRIATRQYQPNDDDIVRCRLRTLGVQEYRISINSDKSAASKPKDWVLYDVGGSRTVRRAWIPYFENVNAIIFLAPISAFNESLLEDASVNRLQDSISIWKAICSSKLLANITLVCFLNKCDLLRKKLKTGVRFRDYVPAFGDDKPNDTAAVVKYLMSRFTDIAVQGGSGNTKRGVYLYPTSCTDTKATARTLQTVRDGIIRGQLKDAGLF